MVEYKNIPAHLKEIDQWVLWKYEDRGGKPTKVPYQANGLRASSVDPAHWSTFEDAKTAFYKAGDTMSGIGIVFTEGDNLVGVDLDDAIVDGKLTPWAKKIVKQFPTYAEISPSGNGLKLFATCDENRKGRKVKLPDGGAIEVYHQGRYFTVTGDVGALMGCPVAHCQKGLEWLDKEHPSPSTAIDFHKSATIADDGGSGFSFSPTTIDRAVKYIAKYPPAIEGQDGHGTLFRIACVLVNGFELPPSSALAVLTNHYNATCQPPWSSKELQHKVDQAQKADGPRGWLLNEAAFADSVQSVKASELPVFNDFVKPKEDDPFPPHLLDVPGFIADVTNWINSQNNVKQPILGLMGAIALQATLAGRKVRDKSGQRTNLYIVAMAPSGGGKQAPQTCLKKILGMTGLADLYGGKCASESALAQDLVNSPAKTWLWDEFGRFLAKSSDKPGNAHLHAIQEVLLELWNESSVLWKHKSMADSKFNREVEQPCASFFGLTVAEHFWRGLEESHLYDGFAGRLLVVDTGKRAAKRDKEELDPPQSILDAVQLWKDFQPGGNMASENPRPRLIEESKQAGEVFQELIRRADQHEDHPLNSTIWSRAIEKAKRLAMVYACSADPMLPYIDVDAAAWACGLVAWSTDAFCEKMASEVIDDNHFAVLRKKVLDIIKKHNHRGEYCQRTILLRAARVPAKALNEVLDTLQQSGEVRQVAEGRGLAYAILEQKA